MKKVRENVVSDSLDNFFDIPGFFLTDWFDVWFGVVPFCGQTFETCPDPPQFLQVCVGQYSVV